MTDQDLGNQLEALFRRHERSFFVCALAVTRSPERAEDAVQDAFYRLFRMSARPDNLKAYVYRAVRNAALDQVKRSPAPIVSIDDVILFDPGENPHEAASRTEFARQIESALERLSPDESETIIQHIYAGLTFREIAELRELSINTVAGWYRRGLEKLRSELEDEYGRTAKQTARA